MKITVLPFFLGNETIKEKRSYNNDGPLTIEMYFFCTVLKVNWFILMTITEGGVTKVS